MIGALENICTGRDQRILGKSGQDVDLTILYANDRLFGVWLVLFTSLPVRFFGSSLSLRHPAGLPSLPEQRILGDGRHGAGAEATPFRACGRRVVPWRLRRPSEEQVLAIIRH